MVPSPRWKMFWLDLCFFQTIACDGVCVICRSAVLCLRDFTPAQSTRNQYVFLSCALLFSSARCKKYRRYARKTMPKCVRPTRIRATGINLSVVGEKKSTFRRYTKRDGTTKRNETKFRVRRENRRKFDSPFLNAF